MPPYKEQFSKGATVRVKARETLETFKKEWRYHNPLQGEQFRYSGKEGKIASVSFYHGGDVLYTLEEMPGIWHEQCLEAIR